MTKATTAEMKAALQHIRETPEAQMTKPSEEQWRVGKRSCPLQIFGEALGIPRKDVNEYALEAHTPLRADQFLALTEEFDDSADISSGVAVVTADLEGAIECLCEEETA